MSLQKLLFTLHCGFLKQSEGKEKKHEVKKKSVIHEILVINQDLKTEAGVT